MLQKITRRALVKGGLIAGALVPAIGLVGKTAQAAAMTPLDPNDPMAKALGYVTDGSKVNAAANPTFKATQKCSNCAQFTAAGGCNIFPGHSVAAGGWCKSWAQKPGT